MKVNLPARQSQQIHSSRTNRFNKENNKNSNNMLTITPKKPQIKHDFSTIKEVTEYDDELSEQKMLSSFKAQF